MEKSKQITMSGVHLCKIMKHDFLKTKTGKDYIKFGVMNQQNEWGNVIFFYPHKEDSEKCKEVRANMINKFMENSQADSTKKGTEKIDSLYLPSKHYLWVVFKEKEYIGYKRNTKEPYVGKTMDYWFSSSPSFEPVLNDTQKSQLQIKLSPDEQMKFTTEHEEWLRGDSKKSNIEEKSDLPF